MLQEKGSQCQQMQQHSKRPNWSLPLPLDYTFHRNQDPDNAFSCKDSLAYQGLCQLSKDSGKEQSGDPSRTPDVLRRTQGRDFCCFYLEFLNGEVTLMLPSPTTPHVLVASSNERTLHFPIKILVGTQTVETTALVDSSATGNFIDLRLLSLTNFPLKKLPQPIGAFNVDGTPNR